MEISEISIILSTTSIFLLLILKVFTVLELLEEKVFWIWWWKNKNLFDEIKGINNKSRFWKTTNSDLFVVVKTSIKTKEINFPLSKDISNSTYKISKNYSSKSLFNINKIIFTDEKIYYFFIIYNKTENKLKFKLQFRTNSSFEAFKALKKYDLIYTESSIRKLI